jgi:DNA-binding response OmpR family regulator
LSAKQILVIEDDPDVRETICDALNSVFEDSEVTALTDGAQYLQIARQRKRWDMVVLDCMLPGLSGIDICKRIRYELGDLIPLLLMTGYDTPEMEKKARDAGATRYMPKPFDVKEFMDTVKQMAVRK